MRVKGWVLQTKSKQGEDAGIEPWEDVAVRGAEATWGLGRALLGSGYVVIWGQVQGKEKGKSLRAEATVGGVAFFWSPDKHIKLVHKVPNTHNHLRKDSFAFIFMAVSELNSSVLVLKTGG